MKKINIIIFGLSLFILSACSNIQITDFDECQGPPVCGKINVQCITTPCDPVEETFSNLCEAEKRGAFDIKEGNCISNFDECVASGNPIMESYPRQCRDSVTDTTFTEEIVDSWRLDGISLMQHESEGYFGCFGCSLGKENQPAMCIDPILEMKLVEETEKRYCNENFEVVEK